MTEQTIFLSALDIPDTARRSAYLNDACAGDAGLRQQVEALLAAHERSGHFLDDPAVEQMAAPRPRTGEETVTVDAGSAAGRDEDLGFLQTPTRPDSLGRMAHYEVLEVLGRGGFGTVLRAFDDRLHRMVAIKVLAPQLATSGTARSRFRREAKSGAAVRDEHVVHIYAVSDADESIPYLVMEYIAGQTLQQKLDRTGPLSVNEILRIGSQVARGLSAAHATGAIHRDVKPSNILLENGVERVKLTDFGLARAADDASISHSGVVAGTPMYMSPEQAQGGQIDHRSDLFSLGSVLYAMCTGRPPFRASATMAVLKRVCEEDARPIREINPEVPEWLSNVIAKLHAKKPEDRFQSAKEVAELLGRFLSEVQTTGVVTPAPAMKSPGQSAATVTPEILPRTALGQLGSTFLRQAGVAALIVGFPVAVYLGEMLFPGALFFLLAGCWLLWWSLLFVSVHRRVRRMTPAPQLAKRWRVFRSVCATCALVGSLLFLIAGFVWRDFSARDYLLDQGELEVLPGDGLTSVIVLENPEGVYDGNKLHTAVTDWMQVQTSRTLKLPPGKYQLNAGISQLGIKFIHWQVTITGAFGTRTVLVPAEGGEGWSCIVTVERGCRTSVRPEALKIPAPVSLPSDKQLLEGTWVAVSGEFQGEPLPADRLRTTRLVFTGGNARVTMPNGTEGEGTFKLDSTQSPKEIDVIRGDDNLGMLGIYRLDGDRLVVCMGDPGEPRPKGFETTPDPKWRRTNLTLRRASATETGWAQLFNGKDLSGWDGAGAAELWLVDNGLLVGRWNSGLLRTRRSDFANFHLRAEVQHDGHEFGVMYFRARSEQDHGVTGYSTDLFDYPGGLRESGKDTITELKELTKRPHVAPREWFTLEVIAEGDRLRIKVNDQMLADERNTKVGPGFIGFLCTGAGQIRFRKIEIKELPATPREVPRTAAEVLPFLAGNWKLEKQNRDPKSPPDKDPFIGTFAYSFVAGGKFLRGRSSAVPGKDRRPGTRGLLDVWSFEPDKNMVRRWLADTSGWTSGSVSGQFNPASRTLTTSLRIGDNDSIHQYEFIDSNTFYHHFFLKDGSGAIASEVHHKWTRVGGPVANPNLPLDSDRSDEVKVLDRLVGEWQNEFTVKTVGSSDKPKTETTRGNAESVLGGRFVETIEANDSYTLTWFDAGTTQYRQWCFGSAGTFYDFTGGWNPDTKTMTWKSVSDIAVVSTEVFKSDNRLEFKHVLRAADGKTLIEVAGTSVRQARDVPRTAADVLPFMAGTWKVEKVDIEPKPPTDKARALGYVICDYVAGGAFLRKRGAFEIETVDPKPRTPWDQGNEIPLMLSFYDPARDVLTSWGAWSGGIAYGPVLGRFDPKSRSLLWLKTFPGGIQSTHQFNYVDANTITTRLYQQDETGKVIQEFHMTMTRINGPVTLPDKPTDAKRPDQMKVLDRLVGEWRSEGTVKDAGMPDKPRGGMAREKAQPILGGRFIEEIDTFEAENASHYSLFWFDEIAKLYRYWFFHSAGFFIDGSGTWDEATKTLTWSSAGGKMEGRWVFKSDNEREFHHLFKDGDGQTLYEATGVSRRRASAEPPPAVAPFDTPKAKEYQESWAKYLGVRVETTSSIGMKLRLIPPGRFTMGSPDGEPDRLPNEGPQHEVTIAQPAFMGTHPVTVGQFRTFVKAKGYKTDAENSPKGGSGLRDGNWSFDRQTNWQNPGFAQADDHPVTCVSWNDARAFCDWLSEKEGRPYVLPTESQWEYACRAGSTTRFHFGSDDGQLADYAWYTANSNNRTHPVGTKRSNAWGLYDMHGGVWQWTANKYNPDAYHAAPDRTVDKKFEEQRVVRGGSWFDAARLTRSAYRGYFPHFWAESHVGFRVVVVGDLNQVPLLRDFVPATAPARKSDDGSKETGPPPRQVSDPPTMK